jgi:hypothetical protein
MSLDSEFQDRMDLEDRSDKVRTYFLFLDLSKHVEYRVSDMPLLEEGTVIEFDTPIKDLYDPKRSVRIQGPHRLKRRVLKYSTSKTREGLTQYLEWEAVQG